MFLRGISISLNVVESHFGFLFVWHFPSKRISVSEVHLLFGRLN